MMLRAMGDLNRMLQVKGQEQRVVVRTERTITRALTRGCAVKLDHCPAGAAPSAGPIVCAGEPRLQARRDCLTSAAGQPCVILPNSVSALASAISTFTYRPASSAGPSKTTM